MIVCDGDELADGKHVGDNVTNNNGKNDFHARFKNIA